MMRSYSYKRIAVLILILFSALIFTFLDIGLSSSESSANSNIGSYSSGTVPDSFPKVISIFVERGGMYNEKLSGEMIRALEDEGFDVTASTELQAEYPAQALFVSVNDEDVFYTPVYADSQLDVMFVYSSSGSSEYFEKFRDSDDTVPLIFTSDGSRSYKLLMQGSIELQDITRGLFSGRYYERHIRETVAEEVVKNVQSQL
ncbi:MAG: hypothetical protein SCH66_06740 [Methanolobus sp.]|nr:hypothetical protein [Methanolobus sp.]